MNDNRNPEAKKSNFHLSLKLE